MSKKEVCLKMIEETKDAIFKEEILESYYNQKILGNTSKQTFELALGGVQKALATKRDMLKFMESKVKEF